MDQITASSSSRYTERIVASVSSTGIYRLDPSVDFSVFAPGDDPEHYPEYLERWTCFQCQGVFIDTDEHPSELDRSGDYPSGFKGAEPQVYWLGNNEVFCASCAVPRGIPPTT